MRKTFLVALLASSCGVVPKPQPPPQPLSVQVHVTDTVNSQPIAGASVWAQQTPGVTANTDANGFATVSAFGSGVCAKKDGFFSPGLPDQPETCKPIASRVELALQPVPPPLPPARRGLVTSSHHALGDADGLRFYLGGTAFWYLGGYTTDRERVIQHAVWWQAHGADYLRLLLHASGSGANAFDPNFDEDNEVYAVNTVAFHFMYHPVRVKLGELVRIYLVNIVELDPVNSFHVHGNFFHRFPTGTALEPSEYTDTVIQGQGQRDVLELRFPHTGKYMFHAHKSEFAALGWMGFFDVVA